MKNFTSIISFVIIVLFTLITSSSFGQSTATYTITFNSVWNTSDHGTLPNNAHWSQLVGATHNSNVSFLQMGQIASPGIEKVAEEGDNALFNSEVNTSISAGNANQYINGNDLRTATGNITISGLQVDENFPLLTLVSMIAPSPDWMIAINGLHLRTEAGWKESIILDIFCYDAGSDNGTDYSSADSETNPKQPISSLINIVPFNSSKVGTMTIQLESVLGIENQTEVNGVKVFPNPVNGNILNVKTRNTESAVSYTITNMLGQKLKHGILQNEVVDVSNLAVGSYFLSIHSKGKTSVKRFVKI